MNAPSSTSGARYVKRQLLGRRLGTEPYYTIAEYTDNWLLLRSRPEANVDVGRMFIAVGGVLILLAVGLFCVGMSSFIRGGGPGPFLLSALISSPVGVLGILGFLGGLAISKTVNTIAVDVDQQTITYTQKAKRERQQVLDFDQIAYIRFSTRVINTAFILKRPQPVAVLELITNGNVPWIVDSAADPNALEPVTQALAKLLGVDVRRNLSPSPPSSSPEPQETVGSQR